MKWPGNFNKWTAGVIVIIVLIVTRIVAPDVAEWFMGWAVSIFDRAFTLVQSLGG